MATIEEIAKLVDAQFNAQVDAKCAVIAPSYIWRTFRYLIKPFPAKQTDGRIVRSIHSYIEHLPNDNPMRLHGRLFTSGIFVIGRDFYLSEKGEGFRQVIDVIVGRSGAQLLFGDWIEISALKSLKNSGRLQQEKLSKEPIIPEVKF